MQFDDSRLITARERCEVIAKSDAYRQFVEFVRTKTPARFTGGTPEHFLRLVDHHLRHFVPKLMRSVDVDIREVFDFGCGTGASSVALALVFPEIRCQGTDINRADVSIARERAKLYGVSDRCQFDVIGEDEALPVSSDRFDLCMCCSVLEYVTDPQVRKRCVQEMVRIVAPGRLLFMTVPNRIYPVEIHKRKLGWNYFPKLLKAQIVGCTAWEIERLARPYSLKLHRTPLSQLFTPWTNFCLKKEAAEGSNG
jgi:ubiquinone/menaquinone biosynthesis C-methylase UbiE